MHGAAGRRRRVRIDPSADGATCGGCSNSACNPCEADAAGTGLHFQRAGDVHDADTTAAGLRADGPANFAEIDLASASADGYEAASLTDRDVAAIGLQIGA